MISSSLQLPLKEHLERLCAVLSWIQSAGLKLQTTKCKLFKVSVIYLGHEISKEGIWTNGHKVKAIKNWPVPIMVTELRSFLGFTNYYRHFIKGYAKVACPLYDQISGNKMQLIRKEKFSGWMNARKPLICWRFCAPPSQSKPLLTSPCPSSLCTTASTIRLGAILYQEQDGKDWVITYASRALSKSESHYPAHKLEFLPLKWAVTENFQEYLYSNTSDNNPLTYILTTAKLDMTGHGWIAKLAKFHFTVYYHSEKSNIEVNALSRITWDQNIRVEAVKAIFKAAVKGPNTLMEIYASHEKGISFLILEPPQPKWLLLTGFRPRSQIQLSTRWLPGCRAKSGIQWKWVMRCPQSWNSIWGNSGGCVCGNGFCIVVVIELDRTTMNCNWQSHKSTDWRLCMEPTMM